MDAMTKKLQFFFSTKINLKERKRKQRKENFPPHPLYKEKQNKEKAEKERERAVCDGGAGAKAGFETRKEAFRQEVDAFVKDYSQDMVDDFFRFYSQPSMKEKGKMYYETKECWDTKTQLELWRKSPVTADSAAAKIRLANAKKRQAKELRQASRSQQEADRRQQEQDRLQAAREERERQQAERDAQHERDREGSMRTADYMSQNPDSLLTRIMRENEAKRKATTTTNLTNDTNDNKTTN